MPLMSELGHDRSFGDVGSMSGLPESGNARHRQAQSNLTPGGRKKLWDGRCLAAKRRVRTSIRFSKRAPSSDSPPARPIPPKYVRWLHISHLRAPVPVSSLPPYTNPQIE